MEPKFTASLSRSQEREGWCIIFRHPVRIGKDGRVGFRTRRGLGTKDKVEAERLVEQMNSLLQDETYWTPAAKSRAEREFDSRIISIFYDSMEPKRHDHLKSREAVISMPGPDQGYVRVMLVGTTGAGKTTLLRQFIGSHPERDRFPSTSAAKTTTCDIEIVLAEGPYRAVVSFLPQDHVRDYIDECVSAAILAYVENAEREEAVRRFLIHREQRFRLSYLLGIPLTNEEDTDDDEEDYEERISPEGEVSEEEREELSARINGYLGRIEVLARVSTDRVRTELNEEEFTGEDRDAFKELVEEFVEGKLYENEDFHDLVDEILYDVEKRFDFLEAGSYQYDRGWPITWTFEATDRKAFIEQVNRFSSNHASLFGRLLTPIVQGLRVRGPFKPEWWDGDVPRMVFIDGEGLGHTPDSAVSVPTEVTRRYSMVEAILLVDSAKQPLQAAAAAALRSVASSGHEAKLLIVYTHFDGVTGDNFPSVTAKKDHVLSSLDNCLLSIGKVLGDGMEKSLRRHLSHKNFFLSNIQSPGDDLRRATREELKKILQMIESITPIEEAKAIPVYDITPLSIYIQKATQHFHNPWDARLGLAYHEGIFKEHWTRVKALSRRFMRWEDHYFELQPVADLLTCLREHVRNFLGKPEGWDTSYVSEDEKQKAISKVAQEVNPRLQEYVSKRLLIEPITRWSDAYAHRGYGSTFTRSRDIKSIYSKAAPIPGESPTSEGNVFLRDIIALVREAIEKAGGRVRQ